MSALPEPPPPTRQAPVQRLAEDVLEWFLPQHLRFDPERQRRARLVVATSLVLLLVNLLVLAMVDWTPGVSWFGLTLPRPIVSFLMLAALFDFGVALVIRRTGDPGAGAFLLTAILVVMFGSMSFHSGGFNAPVTWWLAAVPMVAALLSGPRATLLSALFALLMLFLLYGIETSGVAVPAKPLHASEVAQDVLRAQVLLLGFVSFFGWYYERTRASASRDLMGAYSALERTNAALRMSQQNVRQIAENIGQALWMHDLHTDRVVYANPAFDELYQVPRTRLAVEAGIWMRRVHPEDLGILPSTDDGVAGDHVYRIVLDDGEERWVQHSIYEVGQLHTEVHRAIHIVADVTLRRNAEAVRERYLETVLEVQENERRHLARELHDETGQHLTALLVGLRALANTLEKDAQRDLASQLAEQLRSVVGDISRISRGLHPQVLDELGLVTALGRLADDARAAANLEVHLRVHGEEHEDAVTPTTGLTIYRVVQESLTNILRHAQASEVDIELTMTADAVRVVVEDDGRGFDPAAPEHRHELSSGVGLLSMQERAILLGGRVRVESSPGKGTTVLGEVPNRRRAPAA